MLEQAEACRALFVVHELTHGPTYLVFKDQLLSLLVSLSETTDYTDAILIVNTTEKLFLTFLLSS